MSDFKLDCFITGKFLGIKVIPARASTPDNPNPKPKRLAVVSVPVIGGLVGECYAVELIVSNKLNPVSGVSVTPEKFVGQSFVFPVGVGSWEMNGKWGMNMYLNAEPLTVLDAE